MTPHHPPQTPRVMIVEDEARLRELLCDVLPGMGFEPVAVRTAEQALRELSAEGAALPHVFLLDLSLPVMGGLDLLAKLRERPETRATPAVVMTGFGDLDAAKRAIHLGVVEFLTKPCHLGEIEAALGKARLMLVDAAASDRADEGEARPSSPPSPAAEATTIRDLEKRAILAALRRHGGNRSAAAAELGIARRTLYNKLAEYEGDDDWPADV